MTRELTDKELYIRRYRKQHAQKVAEWNRLYYEKKKDDLLSQRRANRRVGSAFRDLRSIDTGVFV